jgi:outer membrane murein-binding lipoprotein Lpp
LTLTKNDTNYELSIFNLLINKIFMKVKSVQTLGLIILGVSLSSCVPYDESGRNQRNSSNSESSESTTLDQKQQETEKKREQLRKKKALADKTNNGEIDNQSESNEPKKKRVVDGSTVENEVKPKPAPTPQKKYPTAVAVPGKLGFVHSPFNNKVIDVRDMASGTLVADPSYPAADKKHFRVP